MSKHKSKYETIKLTSKLVKDTFDYMAYINHAKVKEKKDSTLISVLSWFVPLFSSFSKEDFLTGSSTTLGHTMYFNFEIGNPESKPLFSQLRILCHELQHVSDAYSDPRMMYRYSKSPADRAIYEAICYSINIECDSLRNGGLNEEEIPRIIKRYLTKIEKYGCKKKDLEAAKAILESRIKTMIELHKIKIILNPIVNQMFDFLIQETDA